MSRFTRLVFEDTTDGICSCDDKPSCDGDYRVISAEEDCKQQEQIRHWRDRVSYLERDIGRLQSENRHLTQEIRMLREHPPMYFSTDFGAGRTTATTTGLY